MSPPVLVLVELPVLVIPLVSMPLLKVALPLTDRAPVLVEPYVVWLPNNVELPA